jgi:hypothetical protein
MHGSKFARNFNIQ